MISKNSLAHRIKKHLLHKRREFHIRLNHKHPKAIKLLKERSLFPHRLRRHALQLLTGATLASALLVNPSQMQVPHQLAGLDKNNLTSANHTFSSATQFSQQLREILPKDRGQLNPWEIGQVNQLLQSFFQVTGTADLENHRLDHQYGLIGMEQHLKRFPGDNLHQHNEIKEAGIAAGLSAWGYFSPSKSNLTETDILREKYYVAVQTLYLPEWNDEQPVIKDWYKYRKVVVINPENGKAVIANIADAGPAKWTGKVYGGSPEVMHELQLDEGPRKGQVVLLFVDDPEDKVPLGPLN